MYCSVAYTFQSEVMPRAKCLVFKVSDNLKLQHGDAVLLETKYGEKLGVVNKVFEEDTHNFYNMYRTNVLKKVHGNTVAAAVRKRFKKFSDISLTGKHLKKVRKAVRDEHGDDGYYHILLGLCLGNLYGYSNEIHRVFYNGYIICYKELEDKIELVQYSKSNKERKWINSCKAFEEFNKLYMAKFGSVPKLKSKKYRVKKERLPVASHLNKEEYEQLKETHSLHVRHMWEEDRAKYSVENIVKVEHGEDGNLHVHYASGDWWHYTKDRKWY